MAARLPTPGGDDGTWGDILNSFLEVSHGPDGALNNNVIGTNQLQDGSVTAVKLAGNIPESSVTNLTNDLAAKAPLASPTFTGTVTTPALKVAAGAGTAGQVLTSDASGNAAWQTTGGGTWGVASPLGSTQRPVVDLLMSAYDTNAASTDHTAAFQNALAAAATIITSKGAAKVRIILDSRQKYTIGGAVQAGANGQWAQVPLPYSTTATGTIQLVGMPRGNDHSYISIGQSGTVIESTLSSAPAYQASRGIASIFGGPASYSSAHNSYSTFSFIKFATQDITIRSASPVIAGIDAGWLTGFGFDGLLQFDTDQMAAIPGGASFNFSLLTPCTAPQAIALILPFANDWYGTLGDTLVVSGWTGGVVIGEWAHIRRLITFALTGASINLDTSGQLSQIDHLTEWDCAYGIATCSPNSATPVSPSSSFSASGYSGTITSMLKIGAWNIQQSGAVPPAALDRVADLLDANDMIPVDAEVNVNKAGVLQVGGLTLIGSNGATGGMTHTRIRDKLRTPVPHTFPLPASGTAIRNPFFRDGCILAAGGTFSAVTVDNTALPFTTIIPLRANGTVTFTYTGTPTVYFHGT